MNPTARKHYRFAAGSLFFVQGLVFSSFASRIPDLRDALGIGDADLGMVLFLQPVGQISTMFLWGHLVGRLGSKTMASLAAVAYPLALVSTGIAAGYAQFAVTLFLLGAFTCMCNISVNTQGVGVERLYGRSIMASFHGVWSVAGIVAGIISSLAVRQGVSPFVHFCGVALLSAVIMLTARGYMLPRDKPAPQPTQERKSRQLLPERLILFLGLAAFVSMMCESMMINWSGIYFKDIVRPKEEFVRVGYIAFMSTMALGRFVSDSIGRRFGADTVIKYCGILIAVGLLTASLFPSFATATLGFLVVGLGASSIVPMCYGMAGKSKNMNTGIAIASVSIIGIAGYLSEPLITGFIAEKFSLRISLLIVAAVGLSTLWIAPAIKSALKKG